MYTVKLTSCEITVRITIQKQNVLLHCLVDSSTILLIRLISVILNINSIYVYIYTYIYIYYTILLYIYTILYYCIYIYTILYYCIYIHVYTILLYIYIYFFFIYLYIQYSRSVTESTVSKCSIKRTLNHKQFFRKGVVYYTCIAVLFQFSLPNILHFVFIKLIKRFLKLLIGLKLGVVS